MIRHSVSASSRLVKTMLSFNIGGTFWHKDTCSRLLNIFDFYRIDKSMFNVSFFDCPDGCAWEGGRSSTNFMEACSFYDKIIEGLNQRGYGFNFVFSNSEIDTNDKIGNHFLEKHHNKINGVIIGNENFRDYVEKNYPLYKRIKSVTSYCFSSAPKIVDSFFTSPGYDLIVVPPDLNRNEVFLSSYANSINKFEFLVNEFCIPDCDARDTHYRAVDKRNRVAGGDRMLKMNDFSFCLLNMERLKRLSRDELLAIKSLRLTEEEMVSLVNRGAKNFKISLRSKLEPYVEISRFVFPFMRIDEVAWRLEKLGLCV